jgi:hypothetical protein
MSEQNAKGYFKDSFEKVFDEPTPVVKHEIVQPSALELKTSPKSLLIGLAISFIIFLASLFIPSATLGIPCLLVSAILGFVCIFRYQRKKGTAISEASLKTVFYLFIFFVVAGFVLLVITLIAPWVNPVGRG